MDTITIVGIIGTAVTVVSFIYAIYVNRELVRLRDYNREQAWEIYRQSYNVLARYQDLQALGVDNKKLIENVAAGETSSTELVVSSIQMIKRFEKKFDSQTIDEWYKQGKLPNESHLQAFKRYV